VLHSALKYPRELKCKYKSTKAMMFLPMAPQVGIELVLLIIGSLVSCKIVGSSFITVTQLTPAVFLVKGAEYFTSALAKFVAQVQYCTLFSRRW
jgi:hypothetical protein